MILCLLSCSVVSYSLRPHGLQPTRFLCPWDCPGKNTGVGCHFLLQGIFLIQRSNPHFLHWQADSLPLSHPVFHIFPCHLNIASKNVILPFQEFSWIIQCSVQSHPALCDPMDCSMPGFPVHHQLPELAQTHFHQVSDSIQPSHPLLSPSPSAFNLSQHQCLFQ